MLAQSQRHNLNAGKELARAPTPSSTLWIGNTAYLWVCIGASAATWFLAHFFESLRTVLLWADAVGLALFSVLGTQKALAWDAPLLVAIGMGMMTATFGSLIRDGLLGREVALPLAVAAAFALRGAAILFDLRLPKYRPGSEQKP